MFGRFLLLFLLTISISMANNEKMPVMKDFFTPKTLKLPKLTFLT
jgi:hypothetical protein